MKSTNNAKGRYVQGGITDEKANSLGWWERKIFPESPDDSTYVLVSRYHKRPDLLAYDAYGSSHLAWLILQYNNIVDINSEFVSGATVKLPTRQRVAQQFLAGTR